MMTTPQAMTSTIGAKDVELKNTQMNTLIRLNQQRLPINETTKVKALQPKLYRSSHDGVDP